MVGFRVPRWNARGFCHRLSSKLIMPGFVTNFTSAKKMKSDLETSIDNVPNDSFPDDYELDVTVAKKLSNEIPAPSEAEMDQFFAELSKSKNKPIALSLIPEYAGSYVCQESLSANNKRSFRKQVPWPYLSWSTKGLSGDWNQDNGGTDHSSWKGYHYSSKGDDFF